MSADKDRGRGVTSASSPGRAPDAATSDDFVPTPSRLTGRVVKLTFKRLKDGGVRHWTRIEFEPGTPYKSVSLSGTIPAGNDPETTLLLALTHRYAVPHGLPEPRWWT